MDYEDDFEKEQEEYGRELVREIEDLEFEETALPAASRSQGADTYAQTEELIDHIKQSDLPGIDREVFGTLIDLVVLSGLDQNEIPGLTIDDLIYNELNKISKIRIGPGEPTYIDVSNEVSELLEEYVKYRASHYKNTSELFPGYTEKEINRDFNAYKAQLKLLITFHDLHKFGIKRHYEALRKQGMGEKDSLEATGKQFRMSPRAVKQSIEGKTKLTGEKPLTGTALENERLMEYLDNIVIAKSIDEAKEIDDNFSEFLRRSSLSVEDKEFYEKIFKERKSDAEKRIIESSIAERDKTEDKRTIAEIVGLPKRTLLKNNKE